MPRFRQSETLASKWGLDDRQAESRKNCWPGGRRGAGELSCGSKVEKGLLKYELMAQPVASQCRYAL